MYNKLSKLWSDIKVGDDRPQVRFEIFIVVKSKNMVLWLATLSTFLRTFTVSIMPTHDGGGAEDSSEVSVTTYKPELL